MNTYLKVAEEAAVKVAEEEVVVKVAEEEAAAKVAEEEVVEEAVEEVAVEVFRHSKKTNACEYHIIFQNRYKY